MANIWDKFDKNIDVEGLKADAKEAAENGGGDFKEVPHGEYEAEVNKLELRESKKGDPMLSIWFKILTGEYKGSLIFYNQVLSSGFGLHKANEMLRSLDSGVEVEFESFSKYNDMLMDMAEAIDGKLEYQLSYTANKKNNKFSEYEIKDIFEV
ncbi:DUF669 domain-containing protein [Clostridium botulinum]|uniref:DUF669 domain-containing protein n=1 Tax=Clostridium botulinum (strain Okra / Type B1) TaxID=498213 RepID=B1IGP5_CLOBK|nr:DUF669 domain-containing protein [Clostridium botulinum]EKX80466.1 hypothetical protein CFSAN001628_006634 [Clostridium botulinum CFSAN001628]ACA46470.1 conserved hypothetical protein [Clostridium botulinum B1 str. Okra]MBD5564033.1 DUF669 domain-containing protein [Clostridium botulinum]MBD5566596.1 DUF669 domain-containing protein [Clostridium botulinum]MBD5568888.1 DUF669 domain-containing protein [Clostridium botulinum]